MLILNRLFMICNVLKKLNMFRYFNSAKNPEVDNEFQTTRHNDSILLSVPLYFYLDFIKAYYKSFVLCFIALTVVLIAYIYVPTSTSKTLPSLPWNQLATHNSQISDSTYIQTYSPAVYEEMLKELRKMQQAAAYLQIKQQANDRKTLALQQQIQKLRTKTDSSAGVLNEEKAQNMIKEALLIYDADKLGLRDYALEAFGGSILSTPFTQATLSYTSYVLFGLIHFRTYSNPRTLIQSDVQPGKCYTFEGSKGRIRIKLSNDIYISAITLEHVSASLLTQNEIQAVPKHFSITGLLYDDAEFGYPLGQFVYSIEGPPRQTFLITSPTEPRSYEIIEFEVLSNYGNADYTCVYRLRVHGQIVK